MATKPGQRTGWLLAAAIAASAATASRAGAQEVVATSFDQMKMLVRPGDTVTITDAAAGRRMTGQLAELSSTTIALLVDGSRRELTAEGVATVHQRRSASLGRGAKIGAAIGGTLGVMGAVGVASSCNRNCDGVAPFVISAVLAETAFGAGVGVGIAAITRRDALVYTRPSPSARVTVAPFATPSRRGVALSVGF